MKKALIILSTILLLLSCCACNNAVSNIHKARNKAVDIGDKVIANEISVNEAKEQLNNIFIPNTDSSGALSLKVDIDYLNFCLISEDYAEFERKIDYMKNCNYE